VKVVLGALSKFASTQFSLTVYEYTKAVWVTNPFVTSESSFRGNFLVGSDSIFLDKLRVHKGSVG
jgi:hypothetical protein